MNPSIDVMQTTGVSWLLNLLGFRTIDLSRMKGKTKLNLETIRGSRRQDSCDLLAVLGTDKVLAVDCTITVPPSDKIEKIHNTANAIAEVLVKELSTDVQIVPTIISSANCGGLDISNNNVVLLDRNDVSSILDLVSKGLQDDAVMMINKEIARSMR